LQVSAAIATATSELAEADLPSPRVDAELLAAHVLGVARGRLPLQGLMQADQYSWYHELVSARATRVPLQHLTGVAAFRGLQLSVGPGVFIPRPETELLVEWGLAQLAPVGGSPVAVDLCAGTGAIALSLATELPRATVYAVESQPHAQRWLRRNAYGRAVTVVDGDATDPATLSKLDGSVDLVLSNPPYVPSATAADLAPEVWHDPVDAVFAGADGLDVIRPLIPRIGALLAPGGRLALEHAETHGPAVGALLAADGRFVDVATHPDLTGRPRFTTATRGQAQPRVAD
jgi:release factor glutamine methyltransferase